MHKLTTIAGSVIAALTVTQAPTPAWACGGFFCSQTLPVNQAAERIIFVKQPNFTMTAVVQILYQGPSERFAWVLPVPSKPKIGVSSNTAFQRLQTATNPIYRLTTRIEGTCASDGFASANRVGGCANCGPPEAVEDAAEDDVVVVDAGTVGPYDYEVIAVDPNSDDAARVAVDWLQANKYDVTEIGPDVLRPYLETNHLLVAFRLTKNADSGDIRPVVLTFMGADPMIPIRPTAVAANDDMGVLVWVLGEARAVPTTYKSLVLNEAAIDWVNSAANYNDVVNLAANEAGGQGFVTELAGPSLALEDVLFTSFEASEWARLNQPSWQGQDVELLLAATATFGRHDGYAEVFREWVPRPQDVSAEQLMQCIGCYYQSGTIQGFDAAAFLAAMKSAVIDPLVDTQKLVLSQPYVTRLYTTLSAGEMTVDPEFSFNPDLPEVSSQHDATRVIECHLGVTLSNASWRIELPQGDLVRGVGRTWPLALGSDVPAALTISQLTASGIGDILVDNRAKVRDATTASNRRLACGCNGTHTPATLMVALSALLAVAVRGRRHMSKRSLDPAPPRG